MKLTNKNKVKEKQDNSMNYEQALRFVINTEKKEEDTRLVFSLCLFMWLLSVILLLEKNDIYLLKVFSTILTISIIASYLYVKHLRKKIIETVPDNQKAIIFEETEELKEITLKRSLSKLKDALAYEDVD